MCTFILASVVTSLCCRFSSTANFDYFKNQAKLHQLYGKVTDNQYVVSSSVSSWYEDYITWAKTNKASGYFEERKCRF